MKTDDMSLSFNEKVIFALRRMYLKRGYSQYKMSKFEEYDLYARNKDFLISDSVITFTDTSGKLMALKPDVTLSIIKNMKDNYSSVQKVCYNENVYRISKGTRSFKEIMQVGLECFGDIDDYNICEVITLAAKSLRAVAENAVLDISHLGLISEVIDSFGIPSDTRADILRCIGDKNIHELGKLCADVGVSSENTEVLKLLVTCCGRPDEVLPRLRKKLEGIIDIAPIEQLSRVFAACDDDIKNMLRIDFSVVSDINYYNGIVFKGFIEGVPTAVLSGGQYDKLMQKMKRKSGAIGFAVYLDTLERLDEAPRDCDVDTVLLYSAADSIEKINKCVGKLASLGKTVLACKQLPENIKYRTLLKFNCGEVETLENND